MKRVSLVGQIRRWTIRNRFVTLCGGFALCLNCGVSHAGTWNIYAGGTGTNISERQGQSYSWAWNPADAESWESAAWGYDIGDSLLAETKVTPKIRLRWTPSNPNDTLPRSVSVLVMATAKVRAEHKEGGETSFTITVSPGIVDSLQSSSNISHPHQGKMATYKKLFKVSTNGATPETGGSFVKYLDVEEITAKGTATISRLPNAYNADSGDSSDEPALQTEVKVAASEDNRSVTISSPSIGASYHRTMDANSPISKYRNGQLPIQFVAPMIAEVGAGLLNEPKSDGSFEVDSVTTWDAPSGQWMAQGTFQANTPGFSNPVRTWHWSGGNIIGQATRNKLDSGDSSINIDPYSGPYYDLNGIALSSGAADSGMPYQSTLTLKATDDDGAEGENTYAVTWHLPYEKIKDLPDGEKWKHLYWKSNNPLPDGGGVSVEIVPAEDFDLLAAIDDVFVLADAAGVPTEPISGTVAIFKALTNISQWKETAPEIQITSTTLNNSPYAFRATVRERPENIAGLDVATRNQWRDLMKGPPPDDLEEILSLYDCFAGRVRYHHRKRVLADKYDVHGFAHPNSILSHDVLDRYEWETYYTLKGAAPNPPSIGDREIPPSFNFS